MRTGPKTHFTTQITLSSNFNLNPRRRQIKRFKQNGKASYATGDTQDQITKTSLVTQSLLAEAH
jgi:hypothetical protein